MNNIKIFSGNSHQQFAQNICQNLGITLGKSRAFAFSNDNRFVKIDEPVRGADVYIVQTSASPVDANLMEMLMMIRALKGASAARITAVMPYLPYARSDKKDQERICLTARLVADLIETAGADHALVMEMHSHQIQGFFSIPCDHLVAAPTMINHLKNNWNLDNYVLVAGDAGAAKILKLYADGLKLSVAIMDKRRDSNDEQPKIKGVIGEVTGKKCLLIDDEVASGRTLIRDAEFLLGNAGALSVEACATHAVLSGNAINDLNASPISKFIFTDTIPLNDKKLKNTEIVSVVDVFAECIRRLHENESIKSLNDV
ncbi:MAG: ribose-phosphate pyrophosphokinase [Candidatus Magasanikbacteria bacterium]